MIKIFTDGSTKGNGTEDSVGGNAIVVFKDDNFLFYKNEVDVYGTTNNREELKAIISAIKLATFDFPTEEVEIYSDSAYCVNIINDWMWTWFKNGWKRSGNKPVENLDLIQEIFKLYNRSFVVNFVVKKCKGHNGELGNEIADAAATNNQSKLAKIFLENDISYEK